VIVVIEESRTFRNVEQLTNIYISSFWAWDVHGIDLFFCDYAAVTLRNRSQVEFHQSATVLSRQELNYEHIEEDSVLF
jgi:hypothetical protein